ncbi:type VI-B CRISPR-associated RNA-guided ribonuclease Cas13b [Aquimarina hainanensis]|uniref:Type VI-B CRISPR-associated RNA-guided ribonuclease Cas13b n=1 Tax=Aquimarina hainanensis TaxID=1578017 RepID=A0ABW5NER3_9FLAO
MLVAKQTHYDCHSTVDKHYFASFCNDAQLNLEQALISLWTTFNPTKKIPDIYGIIDHLFPEQISQGDWNYRTKKMLQYFNWADQLWMPESLVSSDTPPDLTEIRALLISRLRTLYRTICNLRNYYTHKIHHTVYLDPKLSRWLDRVLLHTVKDVMRQRFNEETMEIRLPKRYDALKQLKGSALKKEIEEVFSHLISPLHNKDKKEDWALLPSLSSTRKNHTISTKGFAFLISLFLPRKEMEEFLDHTRGFKSTETLSFQVTRWVFTYRCFKKIKKVLRSDYSDMALALQMLDELSKCPTPLYNQLAKKYQWEFIEDINEYIQDHEENEQGLFASTISHQIIRRRYEDKFPYFAIRFLDETLNFTRLFFQIVLGTYEHDRREKNFSFTLHSIDRSIKEQIKVFGKLSAIQKAKEAFFTPDTSDHTAWQRYPGAHYAIENNKIAIYHTEVTKRLPDKDRKNRKDKKTVLQELGLEDIARVSPPTAYLSVHELPAMVYTVLQKLQQGIPKETIRRELENRLRDKIRAQYLSDTNIDQMISSGQRGTLPDRIYETKVKKQAPDQSKKPMKEGLQTDKLRKDLHREIQLSIEKRNALRKTADATSRLKNWLTNTEKGELATWICQDIKRFISKNTRTKWKSTHSRELQAMLSQYDHYQEQIIVILQKDIGYSSKNEHPFLEKALKPPNLILFADRYLQERISYLRKLDQEELSQLEKAYSETPIHKKLKKLKKNSAFWLGFEKRKYVLYVNKEYLAHLQAAPINLSRGLFDDTPTVTDTNHQHTPKAAWFEHTLSSLTEVQEFYSYPRTYYLRAETTSPLSLDPKIPSIKTQIHDQEATPTLKNKLYKNEGIIRRYNRQDVLIAEMATYLLRSLLYQDFPDISLKDCFLSRAQKKEQNHQALLQRARTPGDTSDNIINQNHLWSQRFRISVLDGRIYGDFALKDSGKIYRLLRDKRVMTLLQYDHHPWEYQELLTELETYSRNRREIIFREIHRLEEHIHSCAIGAEDQLLDHKGNQNFRHYLGYFLKNKNNINEEGYRQLITGQKIPLTDDTPLGRAELLIHLRNKVAHNQYISPQLMRLVTPALSAGDKKRHYADQIQYKIRELVAEYREL